MLIEKFRMLSKLEIKNIKLPKKIFLLLINIAIIVELIVDAKSSFPQISNSKYLLYYNTLNNYRFMFILISFFLVLAMTSIKNFSQYKYLLSFPLSYMELILFINLSNFKKMIPTLIVNLVLPILLGIYYKQKISYYIMVTLSLFIIIITTYLLVNSVVFIFYGIISSDVLLYIAISIAVYFIGIFQSFDMGMFIESKMKIFIDGFLPICMYLMAFSLQTEILTKIVLVVLILLILLIYVKLYEQILRALFYKVVNKLDKKAKEYKIRNISNIKMQKPFNILLKNESKLIFRKYKKFLFGKKSIIIIALISMSVVIRLLRIEAIKVLEIFNFHNLIKLINLGVINDFIRGLIIYLIMISTLLLNWEYITESLKCDKDNVMYMNYMNVNVNLYFNMKVMIKLILMVTDSALIFLSLTIANIISIKDIRYYLISLLSMYIIAYINTLLEFNFPYYFEKIAWNNFLKYFKKLLLLIITNISIFIINITSCIFLNYNIITGVLLSTIIIGGVGRIIYKNKSISSIPS